MSRRTKQPPRGYVVRWPSGALALFSFHRTQQGAIQHWCAFWQPEAPKAWEAMFGPTPQFRWTYWKKLGYTVVKSPQHAARPE